MTHSMIPSADPTAEPLLFDWDDVLESWDQPDPAEPCVEAIIEVPEPEPEPEPEAQVPVAIDSEPPKDSMQQWLTAAFGAVLTAEAAILVFHDHPKISAGAVAVWSTAKTWTGELLLVPYLVVITAMLGLGVWMWRNERPAGLRFQASPRVLFTALVTVVGLMGFIGTLLGFREAMDQFTMISLDGIKKATGTTVISLSLVIAAVLFLAVMPDSAETETADEA